MVQDDDGVDFSDDVVHENEETINSSSNVVAPSMPKDANLDPSKDNDYDQSQSTGIFHLILTLT